MPHRSSSSSPLRSWALPLCVLGFLWFTLINHLRVEWAVNPQYGYGWAVPFLCAFLIWKWWQQPAGAEQFVKDQRSHIRGQQSEVSEPGGERRSTGQQDDETIGQRSVVSGQKSIPVTDRASGIARAASSGLHLPPLGFPLLFFCLAIAWLPTRLIQEANPEWRLVSWALALEVVGLTLLIWKMEIGRWKTENQANLPSLISYLPSPTFPVCFFLIAVPWPTLIEGPLVQFLAHTNAATTVEVVGWMGIPALLRGNIIEVGTGLVGVDDACSGIRSFQATLMISLFLGELFRLSIRRRMALVLGGCLLAYIFNVARTSALVWIASGKGVAAIAVWHDPTGVTILVADFLCLWFVAMALRGRRRETRDRRSQTAEQRVEVRSQKSEVSRTLSEISSAPYYDSTGQRGSKPAGAWSVVRGPWSLSVLAAWFVLAEAGIELWYRTHEAHLARTVSWRVEFPRNNPTFRAVSFSDVTKQFLRYDEGLNGVWIEAETKLQAIFLRWNPGRIAPHLAKSHTPEVCLTAAGHEIISQSDLHRVTVHGLQLPFRSYVIKDEHGPVHVYYCLWEDRADEQTFSTTSLSYANRLAPVLAGRRNSGQRSLEIALWGMADSTEAEAALARELEKLIRVEK